MLESAIGNNVKEPPVFTVVTKLICGTWFLQNHARELFLGAVYTSE